MKSSDKEHLEKEREVIQNQNEETYPDYPVYPPADDIYNRYQEETEVNPENTSMSKIPNEDAKFMSRRKLEVKTKKIIITVLGAIITWIWMKKMRICYKT